MGENLKYAAFISYSHSDEAAAGWLHRALEHFRPPKGLKPNASTMLPREDKLSPVFRDREELASGADLPSLITSALEASGALIVICSPRAAQSQWVNQEIRAFREMHGDERIFALIVEGDPSDDVSCFPPALVEKLGPDGALLEAQREPLAADIRPGKDGKRLAKLKLAAGMLGVGLDDLARREDARERRFLVRLTAASLAATAFAFGLTFFAITQRNEAREQRARAETEAMTATRTAEFMVDLFEIADPNESNGKRVTAEEILEKGVASIETSLNEEPVVQANLMHTMGRAYTGLGLYTVAEDLLKNARNKKASVDASQTELSEVDNAIGYTLIEQGKFEEAKARYSAEGIDSATAKESLQALKVYADKLIGQADSLARLDELEQSIKIYRRAISLLEDAALADTELFAKAQHGMGRPLMFLEDYDKSFAALSTALSSYERLRGKDHIIVSIVLNDLASLFYLKSELPKTVDFWQRSLAIQTDQLGEDHPEVAITSNNLARLQLETGRIQEANDLLSKAIAVERNNERDKHIDFVFFLNSYGLILTELGSYLDATVAFEEAETLLSDKKHRLIGPVKINYGRALCAAGNYDAGSAKIESGRAALASHYSEGNWRYGAADEFSSVCAKSAGNIVAAEQLAQSGYEILLTSNGPDHYFTQRAKKWRDSLN